ncbi:mortality factor 4-like protein 1 [Uloborus diversus]|uniref:mortality factor 4-like protein 1 n=1 Tax=Uloborus diversus TaxID=327109 RepID=UPI0024093A1B|nr:mortality factor 4-like protein 1 [Uloborus diversus]
MAPKVKFTEGEKVLCFHGPLLYEAKCIKSQVKEKAVKYFIHYSGWNKNWDEWVPESRVLKYNEANMQKQKELDAAHGKGKKMKAVKGGTKKESTDREASALPLQEKNQKQKSIKEVSSEKKKRPVPETEGTTPATSSVPETPTDLQRKKRTRAEQNVETEEEYLQKIEIKIKMPEELKHWLVDDWNLVVQQKKLVQLPARVSVESIISDYIKQKMCVKGMTLNKETAITEATNGIRDYFNAMINKQLLYGIEKQQFQELSSQHPDKYPSHYYGAIHLLRLFTRIGGALAYTPLDEDGANLLSSHLYDFLKYVSKNSANYLSLSDYVPSSSE